MIWVIPFILVLLFSILIWKLPLFKNSKINSLFFLGAFLLKIACGLGLTWIYSNHYTDRKLADTFRYFDDSIQLHKIKQTDPEFYNNVLWGTYENNPETYQKLDPLNNWFPEQRTTFYNDNRTVIRVNALIQYVSGGNYWFHLVIFCLIGFLGQFLIYKAYEHYFVNKELILFGILFLLPSLAFWTSGILKECLLFFMFGLFLYCIQKIFEKKHRTIHYLSLIIAFVFLIHLKFYVVILLIPALTAYAWMQSSKGPKAGWKLTINYSIFYCIACIWHWITSIVYPIEKNWSLFTVLAWKKSDFVGLGKSMEAKSLIETGQLENTPISFLINLPEAFFNSLTRPFIWEANSVLYIFNSLENLVVLIFIVFAFIFKGKIKSKEFYFFLGFSVSFLTIVTLVTPILGSLVRYKIPATPFLLMAMLLLMDLGKVKKLFNGQK